MLAGSPVRMNTARVVKKEKQCRNQKEKQCRKQWLTSQTGERSSNTSANHGHRGCPHVQLECRQHSLEPERTAGQAKRLQGSEPNKQAAHLQSSESPLSPQLTVLLPGVAVGSKPGVVPCRNRRTAKPSPLVSDTWWAFKMIRPVQVGSRSSRSTRYSQGCSQLLLLTAADDLSQA